jgi:glycosyltransferase involved in cell wall biosynthesis
MRVLHFAATLGCGGAERQLYLLCRETCGQVEHTVAVASREGRWSGPLRELGVPVHCLGTRLRDPRLVLRMRAEVRRAAPHVVHCWLPSMNVAGTLAAGATPVAVSVRNVDDWKPWFYRLTDRLLAPFWSAVISNSHAGAELIARIAGLSHDAIHVVPNGIVPRAVPPKPVGCERVVVTACRLVPQKRVGRILEAARQSPGLRFRIAGDGPERRELEAAAPSNVEFLGELPDVSREFDQAGLFMLASEREGTSNALLEAMQAGCVPVVTAVGDNPRIVEDGRSGRVVRDPALLPSAAEDCRSSWSRMSEAARNAAARYSVPAMAERTLCVYRSLARATATNPLPRLH